MNIQITGTFDVTLQPSSDAPSDPVLGGATLGRMLLDKRYHGDLQAVAQGQMLSAMTPTAGSAGYVAIEKVSGSLLGHQGSFALQHSGTITRGTPSLSVTVVPDSGTGALTGLAGRLDIRIVDGAHVYDFTGTLPD